MSGNSESTGMMEIVWFFLAGSWFQAARRAQEMVPEQEDLADRHPRRRHRGDPTHGPVNLPWFQMLIHQKH